MHHVPEHVPSPEHGQHAIAPTEQHFAPVAETLKKPRTRMRTYPCGTPIPDKRARHKGPRINPGAIRSGMLAADLIDSHFLAYNSARLREAAQLLVHKILQPDVTVGVTLSGALTPAGLGAGVLVPLIEAGFIDWIVSTGANLYHDLHYALGLPLHQSSPHANDVQLREARLIRIYDLVFDESVLFDTDAFVRELVRGPEFQRKMGTAELHNLIGKHVAELERQRGTEGRSVLAAAYRNGVPIYCPAPGDGSMMLNVAATALSGNKLEIDILQDINETASIVYSTKKQGGKSAVVILGGGVSKNFALQTEPHIQEVLGLDEKGHDYFIQVTDARPDTGGLSGATPAEAVTWGKVDPGQLKDCVIVYTDTTIAWPLLGAYMLERAKPRRKADLFGRREANLDLLRQSL
ncbi:MAG: homospermidine biosynthesis protein [Candidatus Xenobia bacterium]